MKTREYLDQQPSNREVAFVIARAVKDDATPYYHTEYRMTPIHSAWEWLDAETLDDCIVINADHPPMDITGHWVRAYNAGRMSCAVLTTVEDLRKLYPNEAQLQRMIAHYEKTVK